MRMCTYTPSVVDVVNILGNYKTNRSCIIYTSIFLDTGRAGTSILLLIDFDLRQIINLT